MTVAAIDERETAQEATNDRMPFVHPNGQTWTSEEWNAIGAELEKMNTTARLLLSRVDHDLSVQQDILRELRLCTSILQDSNDRARRNKGITVQ